MESLVQNRRDTWLDEMMHTDDELYLIIAAENKRKSTAGWLVVSVADAWEQG